jgi:hypothetical protein
MPGARGDPRRRGCLQSDQAQWLKSTRDACTDGACLTSAYLNRLAELDPLQPGATALKKVTLPPAPALVWVVPPAADTVAAPPNPKGQALRGRRHADRRHRDESEQRGTRDPPERTARGYRW